MIIAAGEMKCVGKTLARLREKKGMTRYAVAKTSRRQLSEVYKVENKTIFPSFPTLIWYSKAIGMKPWTVFREICLAIEAEEKARQKEERQSK